MDKMEDIMTREAAEKMAAQLLVKKTTEAVYDHCTKQEKAITEFVNENCEAIYEDGELREYRIRHPEGTFMWAVEQMKQGKKVSRKCWNNPWDHIFLHECKEIMRIDDPDDDSISYKSHYKYFPNLCCIEAIDWELHEESEINRRIDVVSTSLKQTEALNGSFILKEAIKKFAILGQGDGGSK